ncbi:hypothetical protein Q7P37_011148 [Cladosporium fusiforme]
MDPSDGHEVPEEDHDFNLPHDATDTSKAEAALKAKLSRKRTKTGCLTCRKRRIKCGEERPVCKNCIKSKRHCEGYSQRVVFKPPTFEYRAAPNGGAHITFQAGPMAAPMLSLHPGQVPQYMMDPSMYPTMIPQPDQQFMPYLQQPMGHYVPGPPPQPVSFPGYEMPPQPLPVRQSNPVPMDYNMAMHNMQQQPPPQQSQQQPAFPISFTNAQAQGIPANVQNVPTSQFQIPQIPQHASHVYGVTQPGDVPQTAATNRQMSWPSTATASVAPTSQVPTSSVSPPQKYEPVQTPLRNNSVQSWAAPTYTPRPELSHPIDYQPAIPAKQEVPHRSSVAASTAPSTSGALLSSDPTTPDLYEYQQPPWHGTPSHSQWLADAAVEVLDDDYYDVDSDEDMDIDKPLVKAQDLGRQRTLNKVLMRQHFDVQSMQIRRYDTFLEDGMLERYKVEYHANPLRNPATARVFAHFISVTGPSLSVYERHPVNSSVLFTEGSVPFSQQGLWTYTMPMAALHHQGLLHAMLALSSLHIARLQGASLTPSMQHYAWALKRIHSCVASQNPKKRLQVTTIAASMLLGFYEIMTADHMKWNAHLAGAKQLFVETDFAGMTKQYRQLKREKMARDQMPGRRNSISAYFNREEELVDQFYDVDEVMISNLVGHEVRYEDHGYIETAQTSIPPPLDLSNFAILKDLFWWYCKQDAYQSVVSGNPLLMDYHRWTDCPPRAAIGLPDALYGSFDHLMLILGRIANFASKDRERKLKQMALNGGQWRPPGGMNMPRPPGPPPGQGAPPGPPPGPPPQAGPAFFGMAPPPRQNVKMPASYNPTQNAPNRDHSNSPDEFDMGLATEAALEEYGKIRAALKAFTIAMSSEAFQPLDDDCHTPLETSFGKALSYRSYDIGCLWSVYNMCEIIAIRSHPHMHPASHAAAAIAAKDTAYYAERIGRIAAGIAPGPAAQPLNPTLGSALCDSTMPSFFAAVQYTRPDQRHETVMRIFGIALRTGWGSAELIANGCETSWVKAAEAGRGPPYQRVVRPQHSDDPRLNGSWERLKPDNVRPEEMNDSDRRLVKVKANARLNWAIGIMGTEDDVGKV